MREDPKVVEALVARLKADGMCGTLYVDGFGEEAICIREDCRLHTGTDRELLERILARLDSIEAALRERGTP
jgi:hypothetical protein